MYLVDTSVWIHALRPSGSAAIQARLRPLIIAGQAIVTEWIPLELMTGLPKNQEPGDLLNWFQPVACASFRREWWNKTWHHAARLRKRGISASAVDCLIATVAMEHRLTLIHCDGDFEFMKPILPLATIDWTEYLVPS